MTDKKVNINAPAKGAQQEKTGQDFNSATSKWKASLVPNGISELAGVIFDCEGRGTDFQNNVQTISTYVGQKWSTSATITERMRAKLATTKDFVTISTNQDFIAMLKEIRGLSYNFEAKQKPRCRLFRPSSSFTDLCKGKR